MAAQHQTIEVACYSRWAVVWFLSTLTLSVVFPVYVILANAEPKCNPNVYDIDAITGKVETYSRGTKLRLLDSLDWGDRYRAGFVNTSYEPGASFPDSVDLRDKDTPIKDQGQCGSCWAHAFTEVMEWHLYNQTRYMTELSRMEVTACTQNAYKCMGAYIDDVFLEYGISRRPLIPSYLYPYDPRIVVGQSYSSYDQSCIQCDINSTLVASYSARGVCAPSARLGAWGVATAECLTGNCTSQNMTEIAWALSTHGPLMIGVDASNWGSYKGGKFSNCSSAADAGDHAVVLVGMTDDTWIVRNSWGPQWGDNGYIHLKRDGNENTCGLANQALWMRAEPILKD